MVIDFAENAMIRKFKSYQVLGLYAGTIRTQVPPNMFVYLFTTNLVFEDLLETNLTAAGRITYDNLMWLFFSLLPSTALGWEILKIM